MAIYWLGQGTGVHLIKTGEPASSTAVGIVSCCGFVAKVLSSELRMLLLFRQWHHIGQPALTEIFKHGDVLDRIKAAALAS